VAAVAGEEARKVDVGPALGEDGVDGEDLAAEEVGEVNGGVGFGGVVVCQEAKVGEGPNDKPLLGPGCISMPRPQGRG
jgi:hypothetical protein